jgi:hypothetical protein
MKGFGRAEVVTRNRYALFRTTRIFADLTVMRDALRVVIHLGHFPGKISNGSKRVVPSFCPRQVYSSSRVPPSSDSCCRR